MKKRSVLVLLLATLTVGSAIPVAAGPRCCGRNPQCGQNYVDANGDGICDNFVDNNGDGINDNCPGYGQGQGQGQGQRRGQNRAATSSPKKNNAANNGTIRKVQRKLCKFGYPCGEITGVMNTNTKNALKKFKKAKGLKANAVINKATLKALKIS